ncbi:NIPSNAP family protein [Paenibacillus chondroitinus]|uniref:NIPSNAP family protein n=1 Tax=Paenibacillus chondroitinus TaxID=59842 RepID=A0ABU6D9N6_9BACL|nr:MULTISPECIES: NIPSNAP family protein [Paenibacillus]MCY9656760.1 NIPSNAP family protein [Paenibacillus anseongense]MEB4794409.1 NIPSNAP family protein [Paenibacillus chondroitinus]
MLYELRIYDVTPGKMEAILNRFRDGTISIFAKHEMKVTNFWVDVDDSKERLYYVLEHVDMASRERNFQAFFEDPEWLELKSKSEVNGPLHEKIEVVYMKKASFFE